MDKAKEHGDIQYCHLSILSKDIIYEYKLTAYCSMGKLDIMCKVQIVVNFVYKVILQFN